MISVMIELKETSQAITINRALNCYTKGPLLCVMTEDRRVFKFPLANVWRVTEYPCAADGDSTKVHAQNDDLDVWSGPRKDIPSGYYEVCTDDEYAAQVTADGDNA